MLFILAATLLTYTMEIPRETEASSSMSGKELGDIYHQAQLAQSGAYPKEVSQAGSVVQNIFDNLTQSYNEIIDTYRTVFTPDQQSLFQNPQGIGTTNLTDLNINTFMQEFSKQVDSLIDRHAQDWSPDHLFGLRTLKNTLMRDQTVTADILKTQVATPGSAFRTALSRLTSTIQQKAPSSYQSYFSVINPTDYPTVTEFYQQLKNREQKIKELISSKAPGAQETAALAQEYLTVLNIARLPLEIYGYNQVISETLPTATQEFKKQLAQVPTISEQIPTSQGPATPETTPPGEATKPTTDIPVKEQPTTPTQPEQQTSVPIEREIPISQEDIPTSSTFQSFIDKLATQWKKIQDTIKALGSKIKQSVLTTYNTLNGEIEHTKNWLDDYKDFAKKRENLVQLSSQPLAVQELDDLHKTFVDSIDTFGYAVQQEPFKASIKTQESRLYNRLNRLQKNYTTQVNEITKIQDLAQKIAAIPESSIKEFIGQKAQRQYSKDNNIMWSSADQASLDAITQQISPLPTTINYDAEINQAYEIITLRNDLRKAQQKLPETTKQIEQQRDALLQNVQSITDINTLADFLKKAGMGNYYNESKRVQANYLDDAQNLIKNNNTQLQVQQSTLDSLQQQLLSASSDEKPKIMSTINITEQQIDYLKGRLDLNQKELAREAALQKQQYIENQKNLSAQNIVQAQNNITALQENLSKKQILFDQGITNLKTRAQPKVSQQSQAIVNSLKQQIIAVQQEYSKLIDNVLQASKTEYERIIQQIQILQEELDSLRGK